MSTGLSLGTGPPACLCGRKGTSMHSRGTLLKHDDQRPYVVAALLGSGDAPLSVVPSSTLPDACAALCHELSERLTSTGNYLGGLQRLLEIGHRPGQLLPAEVLERA